MMKNYCLVLALLLALQVAALAASMSNSRFQGTIVSVTSSSMTLTTSKGNQTIALDPRLRVLDLTKSSLDKVQNNSFIGTTVVPQSDGSYKSTEVHVFAESLRGMGEGFTKMNSTGTRMMANAAVRPQVNMMANSAVRSATSNGGGKTVSMAFPGRTITVHIPRNVPVTYINPASRLLLQKGKTVLALCKNGGGKLIAKTIVVIEPGASLGN